MRRRFLLLAGLLLVPVAWLLVSGCGGEGEYVVRVGIYEGDMDGDETGPIEFSLNSRGQLQGIVSLPSCANVIVLVGDVDPDGGVTFTATGCGVTYTGIGTIRQAAPGSAIWTGSGTWTANNGNSGTWDVRRTKRTGAIGS